MRAPPPILLVVLVATALRAHPEIEAGLARLNTAVATQPGNADLYLERGELYARHEEWFHAEANYLTAAELAPRHARIFRARGALALARRLPAEALSFLNEARDLDPADLSTRILRARALRQLGRNVESGEELDHVLRQSRSPSPDLILERAALLSPPESLRMLDGFLSRTGPVPALEMRALSLEESLGRIDAALARLDRLTAAAERKEAWLRRRGDILRRTGRETEARAAYTAALTAVSSLPPWLRESPESAALANELATLARSPSSSPP